MIITFTKKTLKEVVRQKSLLLMIVLLPVGYISFFSFIFSAVGNDPTVFTVGYVDEDTGYNVNFSGIIPDEYLVSGNTSTFGSLYIDLLENHLELLYETNITINLVQYENQADMKNKLQTANIDLGLYIPANLTEVVLAHYNVAYHRINSFYVDEYPRSGNSSIVLSGDPSKSNYQSVTSIIEQSFNVYLDSIHGKEVFGSTEVTGGNLGFEFTAVEEEETQDIFGGIAAGFLVFTVILQMTTIASTLAKEKEIGTINRIKLSSAENYQVFIGVMITQIIIVGFQLLLSISILSLWGLRLGMHQWIRVFIVLEIANFNVSGLAMIISALARNTQEAAMICGIGSAPIGFLSGAFMAVPEAYVIRALNLQFWDIIPTYHANTAVAAIMNEDAMWGELVRSLGFLVLFAIIWFIIGLSIYNQRVIKADT